MASSPIYISEQHRYSLDSFTVPVHYRDSLESIMIPKGMVKDRIQKMAKEIHQDYEGKHPTIVCILKGADKFFGDLTHVLDGINSGKDAQSVPFQTDFLRASSYRNDASTGQVKLLMADMESLRGKDILLVEDIIDTGETITRTIDEMNRYGPASIKVASVLVKRTLRSNGYVPNYAGFSIPDLFVVGYCMDYNEHFRDLSHICIINKQGVEKYKLRENKP